MPTKTMKQIKAAMPHGMEMAELLEVLPDVFALANTPSENPRDVVMLFLDVIDRAGENGKCLEAEIELKMLTWVKSHWSTTPPPFFEMTCALLSNLKVAEARTFMEQQQSEAIEDSVRELIESCLRNRDGS